MTKTSEPQQPLSVTADFPKAVEGISLAIQQKRITSPAAAQDAFSRASFGVDFAAVKSARASLRRQAPDLFPIKPGAYSIH